MSKQEVIDELNKTQEKFYEVWMNLDLDKSSRDTAINVYTGIMIAKTYVDRLDEPQKVKVRPCVAEWFEEHKNNLSYFIWEACVESRDEYDEFEETTGDEFYDWLLNAGGKDNATERIEILIRMKDGYEIEKEPRWIVKYIPPFVDEFRYYSMNDVNFDIAESSWTSDKEDAYPFTEKEKAEAVALLVDGSVEEV